MSTRRGGSCSAASTCRRSGQLSISARLKVACSTACKRRLDQYADGGLGPHCCKLRGSGGGRAAGEGQVDQGARAQRPLMSFTDWFSPLIICASSLTSPSAAHKEGVNGCTWRGAVSRDSSPGCEIEGSILGKSGIADTMGGFFVACGASFASNSAGENHQPLPGCFFRMKNPPVTDFRLSVMLWRGSQAQGGTFSREARVDKPRQINAQTACNAVFFSFLSFFLWVLITT